MQRLNPSVLEIFLMLTGQLLTLFCESLPSAEK